MSKHTAQIDSSIDEFLPCYILLKDKFNTKIDIKLSVISREIRPLVTLYHPLLIQKNVLAL